MHTMGIFNEEPICRLCNEEDETASRIIFECEEALAQWRHALLEGTYSWENRTREEMLKRLLNLIKVTKLFA